MNELPDGGPEAARALSPTLDLSQVAREWAATFDAITDFVSVHDREFRILRANRSLADFLGRHPKELLGRSCHELLHDCSEPWDTCPHRSAIEARCAVTAEVEDPRIGVPLLVTCSPFYDAEGDLVGTVHVARNISSQKSSERERERLIADLQDALATVKLLSGIVPICAGCKKIRDEQGSWTQLEAYISDRSEAEFSHGLCPDCRRTLYPGL